MYENNNKIIHMLEQYANLYSLKKDKFRQRAYLNAISTIKRITEPINRIEQLQNMRGIGKSIYQKIKDTIEGTHKFELELPEYEGYIELKKIPFFGDNIIKKLIKEGINSYTKLKEKIDKGEIKIKLTNAQFLGVKYYERLTQRIERSDITIFSDYFKNKVITELPKGTKYEIVGSYRRGALTSGDIDLLMMTNRSTSEVMQKVLEILSRDTILEASFTPLATTKFMGIISLRRINSKTKSDLVHLDIRIIKETEYPFALLYFTGSKVFNTIMRSYSKKKGYKLNEYELMNIVTRKKVNNIKTEKDIFKVLKYPYVEPEHR